jgi:hypothetical protein
MNATWLTWAVPAFIAGALLSVFISMLFQRTTPTRRAGYTIFLGGPVVFFVMFLASLTAVAAMVLKLVLLICAASLPAMLYFLFIAARRESLFNGFTTYLERLGLLRRWWIAGPAEREPGKTSLELESVSRRRRRVKSYLDRFGAVYGGVSEQFVAGFLLTIEKDTASPSEMPAVVPVDGGVFDFPTIIPVLGATCLLSLGWIATLPPGLPPDQLTPPPDGVNFSQWFGKTITPTQSPVVFAFLGAYFFSLQMVIRRFVRRDLGANAYNAISLRILLAVVGVWVAARVFKVFDAHFPEESSTCLVAAFAIGAFPAIVWQLVTASLKKFPPFQMVLPSLTASQPLDTIDGLSIWHQTRLEEEDVESVPNLSTVDIVDLLLNTKIPPHRLIDWVDQAILLTYLGKEDPQNDARDTLRRYGVRTATALETACRTSLQASANPASAPPPFDGDDGVRFRAIVAAMYNCPNFTLVRNWRGIGDAPLARSELGTEPQPTVKVAA